VFALRWPVAASEKSSRAFLATAEPLSKGRKAAPGGKRLTVATGAKKPKKQKAAASRGSKPKGGQGVSIVDVEAAPPPPPPLAEEEHQALIALPTAYNVLDDMSQG
jgi:hypothetical protein